MAAGRAPTSRRRWWSADPARPADGRPAPLGDDRRARGGGGDPPAGDHAGRPGAGAARHARLARAAAAARTRWWRSRARARRRAGWPRGCAALGAEVIEAPAIRIEPRAVGSCARHRATSTSSASPAPTACGCSSTRLPTGDARALAGVRGRGDRAGHRRRAAGARHPRRRACRSASSRRRCVEALPVDVEGKRVLVARAAEARDVLPDGLRERGARSTSCALYDTVAEPLDEASARRSSRATLRDLHLQLHRALLPRPGGGPPDGARVGLDRTGDQRHRARARPRAVHVEAERHDIDGLVDALVRATCAR